MGKLCSTQHNCRFADNVETAAVADLTNTLQSITGADFSAPAGKTKRILDMANASIQEAKGNVLFVDDGRSYTINLKPQVRFIDASEYAVKGKDSFYGFLAGILAGNYDISYLFVDGFLKLAGSDEAGLVEMMAKLEKLTKDAGTILVLSYSEDAENVPESIRKFAI